MQNKKEPLSVIITKFFLAVIIFVGIVTIIAEGKWLIERQSRTPKPIKKDVVVDKNKVNNEITAKNKTKDETADWKTYRDEEYGFEVKYPKELPVEQGGPLVEPNVFYFGGGPYETAISLVVSDISEKEALSKKTERTEIIVAGQKGMRYKEKWEVPAGWQRGVFVEAHTNQSITVDIEYQGRNYRFHLTDPIENQNAFEIFNQILSTFKFIKKDE
jgi:hypothetical protein